MKTVFLSILQDNEERSDQEHVVRSHLYYY